MRHCEVAFQTIKNPIRKHQITYMWPFLKKNPSIHLKDQNEASEYQLLRVAIPEAAKHIQAPGQ